MVEHSPEERRVGGSNPPLDTMSIEYDQPTFTQPFHPQQRAAGGFTGFLTKYSMGLIKTEDQAKFVMIAIIIIALSFSIFIISNSRPKSVKLDKTIYIDQTRGAYKI